VACAGLVAMGILPAFTALWVLEPLTASPLMPSVAGPGSSSSMSTPTALVEAVQPWLVPVWLLGVTALSLRFAGGWLQVQRLRYHSTSPATAAVSDAVRRLSARLGLRRRVSVLRSPRVAGPLTLGWLRPAILLPASTLSGLDPRQLELVLAHELAHVRRHDYLVNLLQSVAEILLFFHPAAWWLSRRIREEREMCCDDVAVATCGDPVSLARALATLEQHRATRVGLVAAATGGSLLVRVRRLLGMPSTPDPRPSGWVSLLLVVGLLMAIGSGLQRRAEATVHEGPLDPPAPAPIALPALPAAPALAALPALPAAPAAPALPGAPSLPSLPAAPAPPTPPPAADDEDAPAPPPIPPLPPAPVDGEIPPFPDVPDIPDHLQTEEEVQAHIEANQAEWDRFAEQAEAWGELYAERWEAFGEDMEAWGERFAEDHAEQWERYAEEIEVEVERWAEENAETFALQFQRWDGGGAQEHHADALERQAEELERRADEMRRQADEMRQESDELQRELEQERRERERDLRREEREQRRERRERELEEEED